MSEFFQVIEILAVISGGVFGILLARRKEMDFVGVFSVALITAFGGGTLRDLLLDRHPLFWIHRELYPMIIFALALVTSFFRKLPLRLERYLHVPDAFGLGLFTVLGVGYALEANTPWFVASLLGVVTGTFGGVMGDVVCNEVPSLFRTATLYATCSFTGAWVYLGLHAIPVPETWAVVSALLVIVVFRLLAVARKWRLPNLVIGDS